MTRIGILGAGQLASMLAAEAKDLGLHVSILADHPEDPAAKKNSDVQVWDPDSRLDSLQKWADRNDIIIFENEFLKAEDYEILKKHQEKLVPNLSVMATCSDKSEQKRLFTELGLATTSYKEYQPGFSPEKAFDELRSLFPKGFALKAAKGGYDGYGVCLITQSKLKHDPSITSAITFIHECLQGGHAVYGEELVHHPKEIALVTTRGKNGQFSFYPLVETIQQEGICRTVEGPYPGAEFQEAAESMSRSIGDHLDMVGTYAIEFFVTETGLKINEIAPRVHNSGHCTMNSAVTSQFRNHILAATSQPDSYKPAASAYAMVNILGPIHVNGPIAPPQFGDGKKVFLHWYDKAISRPGRKMGHINISAESAKECRQISEDIVKQVITWEQQPH